MSNLNKWNVWYKDLENREPYGDSLSYRLGAEFLSDCSSVEDWGCGKGWFKQFLDENINYVGLDGTHSKFIDRHVDFEKYTSNTDGIFMRHVIEHNYNWKSVLENALASFTKKMVLVIFTPWSSTMTKEISFETQVGVPNISFLRNDILDYVNKFSFTEKTIDSPETGFQVEHLFFITK